MRDFGIVFVAPSNLSALLQAWNVAAFSKLGKRIWKLVPAAICWSLWWERNNRVLRGYLEPAYQVYKRAKEMIIFWVERCKDFECFPNGTLAREWANIIGCC